MCEELHGIANGLIDGFENKQMKNLVPFSRLEYLDTSFMCNINSRLTLSECLDPITGTAQHQGRAEWRPTSALPDCDIVTV